MKQRIDTLDFLRGFALLGIIFANITVIILPSSIHTNLFWGKILEYAISERFFMIFSFLFGIGFYIFITRAVNRGDRSTTLFIRRLLVLLIFGLIHQYFQPGEALLPYAIFGFILIPFYKLKPTINFITAVILMVLGIFLGGGYFMIFPMFLVGLCMGQWRVFENIASRQKGFRWVQIVSLCLLPAVIYIQYFLSEQSGKVEQAAAISAPFVSTFFVTTLTLLLRHNIIQRLLTPLKYLGRMALTNYLVQTALIILAGNLFHLKGHVHQTTLMNIAIGILIIQMIYSTIWFQYFKIGPMEFIWRIATYGKLPGRYKLNANHLE
ncbi:DUF418 domain-containing protein [Oceanobacillus neutriphilus]|uniref:DUF418 domain-containing protein n=1 Tax=Oceanobacillus neutriphilus TaxID=531815 RepID=UPI00166E85B7|nr:DUF418 domain-containing protein [Oceanobacillus neutriphilus]